MAVSSEVDDYLTLLNQVINQLDSIIYDIEDYTLNPKSRLKDYHDLKFDAIPILRKLKRCSKICPAIPCPLPVNLILLFQILRPSIPCAKYRRY